MKTKKPLKLVELLNQLLAEADKMKVGKAYIAVTEELKRISFVEAPNTTFSDLIYKHLIQLAIKDFIHAGRSEASAKVVRDVIEFVAKADVLA